MINLNEKIIEKLNDEQKNAVLNPINSCTKIVAGAGTGKTKIISKRFVKLTYDLLNEGVEHPASHLLVITFTEKAANEMKTRIMDELAANNFDSYGDDIWISTFHGFCSKILRKHSIEARLTPDFALADESIITEVKNTILNALKNNEYSDIPGITGICSELNLDKNLLSVNNLKRLSAITNIENVFEDIFEVIKKVKSLGLTPKEFLEKTLYATSDFSKVTESIPFGFKSTTDYVIGWENHLKPYMDISCRFQEKEAFANLVKKPVILCKNNTKKAENWTAADNFVESVKYFEEMELYITKVTALIYSIYQNELEDRNVADFDDLINKTLGILKNNSVIRAYYQKYFRHIIVDEFQDTNGSQLELIKILLAENEPNITFVGDRKQSIYSFRYAQTENLEELQRFIEQKYGKKYPEIKLEINYRSTPHILEAVNHVTTNSLLLEEKLKANPEPETPFDIENKHVLSTEISGYSDASSRKIIEAKYIASEIQRIKSIQDVPYKDFAVLVKSHSQAELIEKIFQEYGIPAIKKTNKSFFEHIAVKAAICALKLVRNPRDEIALSRILKVHLSDFELYQLKKSINRDFSELNKTYYDKNFNFCDKVTFLYENNALKDPILQNIFSTLEEISKQNLSLLGVFYKLEENLEFFEQGRSFEALKSLQNLRILEKIISDFEQSKNYVTILNFLEYFEKISEDKNFEIPAIVSGEINAVQLLTIHASKGLEFPYTFVAGISTKKTNSRGYLTFDLQYGKKPGFGLILEKLDNQNSAKSLLYKELWKNPRELSEQMRLFYVAVSRAEKYLNIITFTPSKYQKPAEYTLNLPDYIIKSTVAEDEITLTKQKTELQYSPAKKEILKSNYSLKAATQTSYNFSFSRLNTFKNCPNKFLLKYKFQFPSIKNKDEKYSIGSIVHKLIYNSYIFKKELTKESITKYAATFDIEEKDFEKVLKLYDAFIASPYCPAKLSRGYQAEKNVSFSFELNGKNIEFSGDIDLLMENSDGTYTIIDFKTHENLEKYENEYLQQLFIYKKAAEAENKKIKEAFLINLKTDGTAKAYSLKGEEELEQQIKADVQSAIEYLENQENLQNINKKDCSFCEYEYICK